MEEHLIDVRDLDTEYFEGVRVWLDYRMDTREVLVRFVEKRPQGDVTVQFLEWPCRGGGQEGEKVLAVIWDDASWHTCETVAGWASGRTASRW